VPAKFDFIGNEKTLLDWWYKSGVVKKYLDKNKDSKKRFSFIDGPITANNPMGVHHAWGRTLKDLYQRYKNMQGFKQRFQNGFDCQGLWIEVEVEKERKFKTKKDIEKYGIAEFVEDCKNRVRKYSKVQIEQSKKLGYFMDWGNDYYTMSDENNYGIWSFLKKVWQDDNLYKGRDSVPWCPRCGTAISQHEILTEEYKKITHDSIYFELPIVSRDNERFLVWTTTPWTLPGNVALAVHPELEYWLIKGFTGINFWIAGPLAKTVFNTDVKAIKKIKGNKLVGLKYTAPFDEWPAVQAAKKENPKTFHTVVASKEMVAEDEGTGIVHIATGCGTEDFRLGQEKKLPVLPTIDEAACYLNGFGDLSHKNAKNNPRLALDHPLLKVKVGNPAEDYIFEIKPYTHRYPVCWRCQTELVWRVVDEWYIAMDNQHQPKAKNYRQRLMQIIKKVHWIPSFGYARELDWLRNMEDWLISKKRYWGLALPIWECSCGHFEVIGSKEELEKKAVEGWKEFIGHTPHRPWIDKVKIKCPQCGQLISRILDVGNPWLDAGIVSFSTLKYFKKRQYWQKWFPADLVLECFPGQFKNWFYSLLAMSAVLEKTAPFKTLLGHALVRDEKGEEMHKSKGNAIWFDEAAEKMGVDAMRWLYARQEPKFNLNFGYGIADEVRRQYIFLLWNTYRFFVTYANLNGWKPKKKWPNGQMAKWSKLDKWILSRLESTKKVAKEKLDDYHHHEAIKAIEKFLNDLSLWYVRRSRERVNPNNRDKKDRSACLPTLYYVLKNLSLILAPFVPYLTETIWQGLTNSDNSVHLQNWPETKKELINKKLEKQMALVREIVTLGHSQRKAKQIKVRQPLKKFKVQSSKFKVSEVLIQLIKDELNAKEVEIKTGKGELKVEFDTKITLELKAEGEVRELIRQVQILRREAGLSLDDKITIHAPSWPKKWEKEILTRTGAKEIKKGKKLKIITNSDFKNT